MDSADGRATRTHDVKAVSGRDAAPAGYLSFREGLATGLHCAAGGSSMRPGRRMVHRQTTATSAAMYRKMYAVCGKASESNRNETVRNATAAAAHARACGADAGSRETIVARVPIRTRCS